MRIITCKAIFTLKLNGRKRAGNRFWNAEEVAIITAEIEKGQGS